MVRTQVQLTEEQARALKRLAAERNVSVAEVVRGAVDREIGEDDKPARWERAMSHFGKYSSGVGDLSVNHDEYLAEPGDH